MASEVHKKAWQKVLWVNISLIVLLIANMSDQCAIANDGSLKDAADIQWYNNADNSVAIPSSRHSANVSASSLEDFFSSHLSVKKVAGKQHSSRIRKPLKHTTDPDNAEAPGNDAASGQKREKAGTVNPSCQVVCKIHWVRFH